MALNTMDFQAILNMIGKDLPSDLDPSDFRDFGKMTSHIYRAKFYEICKGMVDAGQIQNASISVIIYFATLIKNKRRILNALADLNSKYGGTTWHPDAVLFYNTATVQYVSEAERTGLFPVVNLPSCQPNIAAHFYKLHLKKDKVARSDADLFKKFSENLWFCQLRITPELMAKHKIWETNFWNVTVKKSKNTVSDRYERGFNETYYQTKADDDYKFIMGGKEVDTVFDEAAIMSWLKA
jgi:hypothetical protein